MAVSAKLYGKVYLSALSKKMDLTSDTLKVMLCTSSYVVDQDVHQFKSDVTNEVTGTGYTAGGASLSSVTLTYDAPSNTVTLDAADTAWASSTITARTAVIYDSTPSTDATRPLIGYVDFGADVVSTSGAFSIVWNAAGICTFTVA